MTKKPCPFCGARGRKLEVDDLYNFMPSSIQALHQVQCTNCGALGATSVIIADEIFETLNKTLAIKAWNQRVAK